VASYNNVIDYQYLYNTIIFVLCFIVWEICWLVVVL